MGASLLDIQREAILGAIRDAGRGEWKVLVTDEASWKLAQGVVKEDDILNQKVMSMSLDLHISHIEEMTSSRCSHEAAPSHVPRCTI